MPTNVYIAPFSSHSEIEGNVLSSLRDLFEESFEQTFAGNGTYKVLNRQTVEKILAEANNETVLTSVGELNPKAKDELKLVKADGVIFGEVTDDKDSGEVIVSVKLQSFDSVIFWNHSVTMKRGLIHDYTSRKTAMEQLVASIDGSGKGASETAPAVLNAGPTSSNSTSKRQSIGDRLEECEQPVPNPLHVKYCGTLTWDGEKYNAFWPDVQITATFSLERGQDNSVTLRRLDISGGPGVTGTYRGTVSPNNEASGTATWFVGGRPLGSGTWTTKPVSP